MAWVTLLFAVGYGHNGRLIRCMHVSDWSWSASLLDVLNVGTAVIIGVIHGPRPSWTIPPDRVEVLSHVLTSIPVKRNSVPSTHIRCRMTASLRANATVARRRPLFFTSRIPQLFR